MNEIVKGLVSAILPVHNRPDLLKDAAESVLSQTYRPVELIIVDDGSTDETPSACESLERRSPELIRTVRRPNGGPGAARETGRLLARGEFLQYLDSDDRLQPEKFERQVSLLLTNPDRDICYCVAHEVWLDGSAPRKISRRSGEEMKDLFPALLDDRIWPTVSPLYRRSLTDRIGPWTELRQEEDWEHDARAGALGAQLVWCPEPLGEFRHHAGARAGGNSTRSAAKMRWRAEAHRLIYRHARRSGVAVGHPAMQRFARELFLIARQAGAVGLAEESRSLFDLAREASGGERASGADFQLYRAGAVLLGWVTLGRIARWRDGRKSRARRRQGLA